LYRLEAFMRKKMEILEEKLERVTKVEISRLNQQILTDTELKRMLVTPMEDIPQYRYLYSSEMWAYGKHSLFDTIKYLFEYERRPNIYFSKIGNKFTGFIVYEDNGRIIDRIKMASFKDDRKQTNPILAKDLIEFVLEMASQRQFIEWYVDPANKKAIQQYDALLNRKNLNWKSVKDGKMIKYVVQGFKTQTPTKI
jgi:ribosomal protein S18 acetylase RimI-like enzyme